MNNSHSDVPVERWIRVSILAEHEGVTRREVYSQLDLGMQHSRIGGRIRVRLKDWLDWHERHMQGQVV